LRSLILGMLVACGGSGTKDGDTGASPGTSTDDSPPEWYGEVDAVVSTHCTRCHDGVGIGAGDFTDYATAAAMADRMLARIEAGDMPPPAADPECTPYLDSDHMVLTDEETAVLTAWTAAGTPEGDPAAASPDARPTDTLADPDVSTLIAGPYTPSYTDFDNEYRCFVLDWSPDDDTFLTAIEPLIDTHAVSHHSVLFLDTRGTSDGYITDPATKSWDCPEVVPDNSWGMAYAWAPGNNPIRFADGHGMRVRGGTKLVLQMHYYRSSPAADGISDMPGYRLETASSVDDEVFLVGLGPDRFTIPAGEEAYPVSAMYPMRDMFGSSGKIHGVFPHMHVLGSAYRFWVEKKAGSETCVAEAEKYDFANQPTYWFDKPVNVPEDASIGVECVYNNSRSNPQLIHDPPIDVSYGERTDQEMCFALMYMTF
jgi:hypothetical protein